MKKAVILLLIIASMFSLPAQVRKFEEKNISNDKVFGLTLTKDQKTAYFVNSGGGRDTLILLYSKFENGKWSAPQSPYFSGKKGIWKDIDPFVSPDGGTLLFNSNRPIHPDSSVSDFNIWAVDLNKHNAEPYYLGNEINTPFSDFYATMASSKRIYFASTRPGGAGGTDIYYSDMVDGKYTKAVNVGAPINTTAGDSNPFISPNEDFMIFLNDLPGGFGDSDLYITFRQGNSWTIPQNLGPDFNTEAAEFCPYLKPESNTLFFSRIERGTRLVENIFFAEIDIERYRAKAMVSR